MTRWQTFEICFHSAGRVLLLQSSLKSHVTSKREYHKDKMAGLIGEISSYRNIFYYNELEINNNK